MSLKRRTIRYETMHDVVNEARQLSKESYQRAGEWSLGQVCNHLADAVNMSRDGFPTGLPKPIGRVMRLALFGRIRKRIPNRPTLSTKKRLPDCRLRSSDSMNPMPSLPILPFSAS
jgi:hypothetical protein